MWKTTFLKEICDEIWLKLEDRKYIHIWWNKIMMNFFSFFAYLGANQFFFFFFYPHPHANLCLLVQERPHFFFTKRIATPT